MKIRYVPIIGLIITVIAYLRAGAEHDAAIKRCKESGYSDEAFAATRLAYEKTMDRFQDVNVAVLTTLVPLMILMIAGVIGAF